MAISIASCMSSKRLPFYSPSPTTQPSFSLHHFSTTNVATTHHHRYQSFSLSSPNSRGCSSSTRSFILTAFSTSHSGDTGTVTGDVTVEYDGGDNGNGIGSGNSSGGGGGGGTGGNDNDGGQNNNWKEVVMALAEAGKSMESLPKDLAAAFEDGRIPASIVSKYLELEKVPFLAWLMSFGGFKERLLADDLFLFKVFMECGVGMFTKTAAEYERRRENFFNELEIVFADVVMAVIADFMLVYLPAPTVSLRPPIGMNAGRIAKFFHMCPDNAFQIALGGASYSLLQRMGAIVRNGVKLFAVGTTSSLVGTVVTNAVINAKKAVNKSSSDEIETVPVLSTSFGYGVYMAISSNLRYQILAGVIEQRILETLLHQHKLFLTATCFAVRTGNTFFGSILWVDYARWIGVQKAPAQQVVKA